MYMQCWHIQIVAQCQAAVCCQHKKQSADTLRATVLAATQEMQGLPSNYHSRSGVLARVCSPNFELCQTVQRIEVSPKQWTQEQCTQDNCLCMLLASTGLLLVSCQVCFCTAAVLLLLFHRCHADDGWLTRLRHTQSTSECILSMHRSAMRTGDRSREVMHRDTASQLGQA
jgi:hypothetical protein